MEKPKSLQDALRQSIHHWLDVIARYEEIKNESPSAYIYSSQCPLCNYCRVANGIHCSVCVLVDDLGGCCQEWDDCYTTFGTDDFPAKAQLMVERLKKELTKVTPKLKVGDRVRVLSGHQGSDNEEWSLCNCKTGRITKEADELYKFPFDWKVKIGFQSYLFSDYELELIAEGDKTMSDKQYPPEEIQIDGVKYVRQQDLPKEEKPYVFQAGDVARNDEGNCRIVLEINGRLTSYGTEFADFQVVGQEEFEHHGYKKIGVISDFIK